MHYVFMMAIAAVISIAGMQSSDDFESAYEAAVSGEVSDAAAYTIRGIRRALREADSQPIPDHLRSFVYKT